LDGEAGGAEVAPAEAVAGAHAELVGRLLVLGSILQNSILAENFSHNFSSSILGQMSAIRTYLIVLDY
jgi:hypothetical protein